jgi:hypothetical protein
LVFPQLEIFKTFKYIIYFTYLIHLCKDQAKNNQTRNLTETKGQAKHLIEERGKQTDKHLSHKKRASGVGREIFFPVPS